jgi:hypothetical protein
VKRSGDFWRGALLATALIGSVETAVFALDRKAPPVVTLSPPTVAGRIVQAWPAASAAAWPALERAERPVIRRLAQAALLPVLNGFGVSIDGMTVRLPPSRRRAVARRLALRLERVLLRRIGILVRENRLVSRPALGRLVRLTLMRLKPFNLTVRVAGLRLSVRVTVPGHP